MNTSLIAYTYILECSNGAYYVGSTNDLERRLMEHQAGLGSRYTSSHLPVKLVYVEEYQTIEEAFLRERQIHGWTRAKKVALINGDVDLLKELSNACTVPVVRQAHQPEQAHQAEQSHQPEQAHQPE